MHKIERLLIFEKGRLRLTRKATQMVVDSKDLYIIFEAERGYNLDHVYLDEESAELALRNYITPSKVQQGKVWIETIQAKKVQHCCEM
ncbi:hypothetical protein GWN75_04525 [candidate division KSB1 bacterium]|nr:hypothetical protein [candidate division KSB1 bacterium]